jgi:hypothetical protein
LSVTPLSVGIAGAVENDSEPAVTENWVLSSCVAADAAVGASAGTAQASTASANSLR